jgi:hypothetical protein
MYRASSERTAPSPAATNPRKGAEIGDFSYDALPVFDAFERVGDRSVYTPLPDAWEVGATDVVDSTGAIAAGRYKEVNFAGAAIVAAVKNALSGAAFPFVFGGDGTVFAVPPEAADDMRKALGATVNYVADELGLELRAGMLPVAAILAAGHDMLVARYAASSEAVYAMFSGGGATFVEEELKAGRIAVTPAAKDARPDLSGLSCRFSPVESQHGVILSILVMLAADVSFAAFWDVASDVIAIVRSSGSRGGHPLPTEGPQLDFHSASIRYEAAATRRFPGNYLMTLARLSTEQFGGAILSRTGWRLGPLDVRSYRNWVTRNSDFRKFGDGLKMTVDCPTAAVETIRERLKDAEKRRVVDFGLFVQTSALVTCLVPSVLQDDHLHFLDGAGGGYARAAADMKRRLSERREKKAA